MAKKKKKKHHRRQQATPQKPARQQGNAWLSKQLELLNRIQPRVAEAAERQRRARERQEAGE